MDNNQNKFQTTGKFHLDLDRVKTDALEMGGMVESQLYSAMGLIKKRNDLFATKIIENDIKINKRKKNLKINDHYHYKHFAFVDFSWLVPFCWYCFVYYTLDLYSFFKVLKK